jgi:hypothetical protein
MARNAGLAHAKPVLAAHAVGRSGRSSRPPANGAVKRLAEQVEEIARSVPFGISHVVHMANPKSRRVHR